MDEVALIGAVPFSIPKIRCLYLIFGVSNLECIMHDSTAVLNPSRPPRAVAYNCLLLPKFLGSIDVEARGHKVLLMGSTEDSALLGLEILQRVQSLFIIPETLHENFWRSRMQPSILEDSAPTLGGKGKSS